MTETIAELKFKLMQSSTLIESRDEEVKALSLEVTQLREDAKLSDMAWKDNQAALKAQAETIARLEAELAQCKHALDNEGEMCKCGHTRDEHNYDSIDGCAHVDDFDFCPCMNYEAAK